MTYVDTNFLTEPLISGRAHDRINRFFRLLGRVGGADQIETAIVARSEHQVVVCERGGAWSGDALCGGLLVLTPGSRRWTDRRSGCR